MQSAFVIAIALTGLGCQNKSLGRESTARRSSSIRLDVAPVRLHEPVPAATPLHRPIPVTIQTALRPTDVSDVLSNALATRLRSTLCSFVLGHDPDMTHGSRDRGLGLRRSMPANKDPISGC